MTRLRGLLAPAPEIAARGERFARRRAAWRAGPQRHYPQHARLEPYAPAVMAALFDRALAEVGPVRIYACRVQSLGETVRLNPAGWHWHTMSGSAEGRGLYELWAWRYDLPVTRAADEIWACIAASLPGEARRAKEEIAA